jgi:hypothetical protein
VEKCSLIRHHGFEIVLYDFSRVEDLSQSPADLRAAAEFMETRPKGEVLVLTDVTGSSFNQSVIDGLRELAEHNRPWVKKSALVGLSPLMRIVFRAVSALTRREIKVFDSRESALTYLTGHATRAGASPRTP